MKPSSCPGCGKSLDAATCPGSDTRQPLPGEFTVCLYCAAVLVFTADLGVREATLDDLMTADPQCRSQIGRFQQAVRRTNRS